jgi:hypothetical protein
VTAEKTAKPVVDKVEEREKEIFLVKEELNCHTPPK